MKLRYLLFATGLLLSACRKDADVTPQEAEDPDWVKLTVPTTWGPDQAYSVAGDLDKTLLVSASVNVYSSTDQGKTWQVSRVTNAMAGLLTRNDTIFALLNPGFINNDLNERAVEYADVFSTDLGKTWANTRSLPGGWNRYRALVKPLGRVAAAGVTYRTRENNKQVGTNRFQREATDLMRTTAGGTTTLRLSARHYLNDLHLDAQNRLYVAASPMYFDKNTGEATENATTRRRAIVYVSRRPLP